MINMFNTSYVFILFLLSITLHNIEEALWLPQWSKHAEKFHKKVNREEFHFALIVITLLAYLDTSLFIFFTLMPVLFRLGRKFIDFE